MSRTTRSAIGAMHPTLFSLIACSIALAMALFIGSAVQSSLQHSTDVAFEQVPKPTAGYTLAAEKMSAVFR